MRSLDVREEQSTNEIQTAQAGEKGCFATSCQNGPQGDQGLPDTGASDRGGDGQAASRPEGQPPRPRTIIVRRLKGSVDSTHYLERDEVTGLKALQRHHADQGIVSDYVFVNERRQPFNRMGIARIVERAGEAAKLPFPVHVHMLRRSTGYALAGKGMDTRRLQHFLGHASITNTVRYTAMSPEPFKDVWR
jgi:hypothetical protein